MGLLLQDKNGIYDDTIIPHAYDRTIEAYMEADSALVHDGGVWREVWPEHRQEIHYLMLYDRGNECVDVTGGWEYVQEAGIHNAAYIGGGIWRTKKKIDFSGYSKGMANRWTRFISGSSNRNYTLIFSVDSYKESENQLSYKGLVKFDTKSPASLAPYIKVYSNTYYPTVNRGEKRDDCLYIYHKYSGYSETEEYVYTLCVFQDDDWQAWLSAADLDAGSYGSLNDVMQDAAALGVLLASRAAASYMIFQCTGSVMVSAIQSRTFLEALDSSPYKDKIYANEHWGKFLTMETN